MSTPISRRLLAAPVALLLAAGLLAGCDDNVPTIATSGPGSTAPDATAGSAAPPSEGASTPPASDDATEWPPPPTSTPLPEPTGSPTTDPALEEAWSTAARAIADDDSAAFLTVTTRCPPISSPSGPPSTTGT